MTLTHNTWEQDPGSGWYMTRYKARDGSQYGDDIWAESYAQAKLHCSNRNINEVIDSYMGSNPRRLPYRTPSEMLRSPPRKWQWQDLLHCAIHVTHLAVAAGVADPADLLDDRAPLHELAHLWGLYQDEPDSYTRKERARLRKRLIEEFAVIERQVPGLRPNHTQH